MSENIILGLLAFVIIAAAGGALLLACNTDGDRPMPCTEDQVYVWVDHPDAAECVAATDHAQHQGAHG